MALTRREFGGGVLGLAGLAAAGCATVLDDEPADDTSDDSDDTDGGTDGSDTLVEDTDSATPWATGGTAVMAATYGDPFTSAPGTCALTCPTTLGPCYVGTLVRQDVSEGVDGLPLLLALRVLDEDCQPVSGAEVDIWHCSPDGLYSGEDAQPMCTSGDDEAEAALWFRGVQVTDGSGRVDFKTCFPGWYPGRAVHIHFQVRKGDQAWVTSQLYFPQAVVSDIYGEQPVYTPRGQPDTPNARDTIYPGAEAECAWRKLPDGVMQAHKDIVLRTSLADPLCD